MPRGAAGAGTTGCRGAGGARPSGGHEGGGGGGGLSALAMRVMVRPFVILGAGTRASSDGDWTSLRIGFKYTYGDDFDGIRLNFGYKF